MPWSGASITRQKDFTKFDDMLSTIPDKRDDSDEDGWDIYKWERNFGTLVFSFSTEEEDDCITMEEETSNNDESDLDLDLEGEGDSIFGYVKQLKQKERLKMVRDRRKNWNVLYDKFLLNWINWSVEYNWN